MLCSYLSVVSVPTSTFCWEDPITFTVLPSLIFVYWGHLMQKGTKETQFMPKVSRFLRDEGGWEPQSIFINGRADV